MTYLPPLDLNGTEFPQALGEDLVTAIGMIEEEWQRSFPVVDYYPISKETTTVTDPSMMSGSAGKTKFDPLWGEAVPSNMTVWQQPHLSGDFNAADPMVYEKAIPINCRIERGVRETQLKKFGFDLTRNIVATIPTSLLDKSGITVRAGDRFRWNGEDFEVLQWYQSGWYYNTNVILYITMSVQSARKGS